MRVGVCRGRRPQEGRRRRLRGRVQGRRVGRSRRVCWACRACETASRTTDRTRLSFKSRLRSVPSLVQVETRKGARVHATAARMTGRGAGTPVRVRRRAHKHTQTYRTRALARTALALALRTQGHATPARHPPSGRHLTPPRQRCAAPTVNINGSIAFTLIWPIPSHNLTHTLPVTCGAVRRRAPSARRVVSTTVGAREGSPS